MCKCRARSWRSGGKKVLGLYLCSWRQESNGSCHAASFQLANLGLFLPFKCSKSGRTNKCNSFNWFFYCFLYTEVNDEAENAQIPKVDPYKQQFYCWYERNYMSSISD